MSGYLFFCIYFNVWYNTCYPLFFSWNGHKHLKTGWNGTNDHE